MTITEKIQKATEKEFDLTRNEVKKIYATAKRRNKGRLCEMESWFTSGSNDMGFQTVECHIYDPLADERLDDIIIHCCLFDRRRSFVQ